MGSLLSFSPWMALIMLILLGVSSGMVLVGLMAVFFIRRLTRTGGRLLRTGGLGASLVMLLLLILPALLLSGHLTICLLAGQPSAQQRRLHELVHYQRRVLTQPYRSVIHIAQIDMASGARLCLSRPERVDGNWSHRASTVKQILAQSDGLLAINGSYFGPFYSRHPLDYRPHVGDVATPRGMTVWRDKQYGIPTPRWPLLCVDENGGVSLRGSPSTTTRYAVAGSRWLVRNGVVMGCKVHDRSPRTAIGINASANTVWLVVVDGRQPRYSEGMTVVDLANFMLNLGAQNAINLDGGGSSTMAWRNGDGEVSLLSRPIHTKIPLRERPVANGLLVVDSDSPDF